MEFQWIRHWKKEYNKSAEGIEGVTGITRKKKTVAKRKMASLAKWLCVRL